MSHNSTVLQRLAEHTTKILVEFKEKNIQTKGIVVLEKNATVAHALRVLARHRVLSAPVINPGDKGEKPSEVSLAGWVDIRDILNGLIEQMNRKHPKLPTNLLLLMSELEHESKTYINRTLSSIAGGYDKGLMYEGEMQASLLDSIRNYFLNNAGVPGCVVHRIALFDSKGQIAHLVSQLDVIKFIASRGEEMLGEAAGKSVEELGLVSQKAKQQLVCIDPNIATLLSLEKIKDAGMSGAAVVSGHGEAVANLSISDLRRITPEHFSVLALPVAEFLALLHNTSYLGYSLRSSTAGSHPFFAQGPRSVNAQDEHAAVPLITCTRHSSLLEVLKKLSEHSIHRIYVVDPEAKPQIIAVITPTDILKWCSST